LPEEESSVTQTATKPQTEILPEREVGALSLPEDSPDDSREWQAERLRLLWGRRQFFLRVAGIALVASTLIAFLIPKQYTSTAQLMPPDSQSTSAMAMMAALTAKGGGGLGSVAGDLLGMKSSGALFIGVLRSQTSQDRLRQQFDLERVYGTKLVVDARMQLDQNTSVSEDRKSGIITISVTDRSPQRAAALAAAYVDELNSLVAELSTSAAHRERVFLDERLKVVKQDLDDASNQLAQFSSKNNTIDIKEEGKAIVEAAANLAGQMIAAQSQLEGLRQIYTDSNPRVQSLNARVGELRKQLQKIGGTGPDTAKNSTQGGDQASEMPYPSLHNLPLLGVKYADHFRHAKIQETVYELLTEQYELAKVQEAKEIPSVKILDPAKIPEKKSYPPRLVIMALGTFLGLAFSTVWVLGSAQWQEVDAQDPRKILFAEVAGTMKASLPLRRAAQNGNGASSRIHEIWSRLGGRKSGAESADSRTGPPNEKE
jgi:capsule polysaccharide export protein KpsE/RkpR